MSDPNRQEVLTRLTEAYARADKAEAEVIKLKKALEDALVDSGPSPDQVALAVLDSRYSVFNGVIHPDTEDQIATADELDAIDVLCDEYDYGYTDKPCPY